MNYTCITIDGIQGKLDSKKHPDKTEFICNFRNKFASTILNNTNSIAKDISLSINTSEVLDLSSTGGIILQKPDGSETYNRSPKSFVLNDRTILNLWTTKNANGNGEIVAQATKLYNEKFYQLSKIKLLDFSPFDNQGIIFDAVTTSNNTVSITYTEGGSARNRIIKIKEFDIDSILNNSLINLFESDIYTGVDNGQLFSIFSTNEGAVGVAFSTKYGNGPENVLVTAFDKNRDVIVSAQKINIESKPQYGDQAVSCSTLSTNDIACCFQSNWGYGTSWAKVCSIFNLNDNIFQIVKPQFQVINSYYPSWNWGGGIGKLSDGFISSFFSENARAFCVLFDNNGKQNSAAIRLDSEEVSSYTSGTPVETYLGNVIIPYAKCYTDFCNNYLAILDKSQMKVVYKAPTVSKTGFLSGFSPYIANFGKCVLVDYGLQMILSNNFEGISQKAFLVKEDSLREISPQYVPYACFDKLYLAPNGEISSVSVHNITEYGCYLNINQEIIHINETLLGEDYVGKFCNNY